jgi:HK97 family phage major capsid protein
MVDISRATTGVSLPSDLSSEIWGNVVESSVVMAATRQIALPGSGVTVHSITGEPTAAWTAETAEKPVSRHTLANKAITPYKLAVIEPFSMEFRRDLPGLYNELARRLPSALAKAFDETVFGNIAAPGANFDRLVDSTTVQVVDGTDTTADLVAAYQAVVNAGGDVSAWLASPQLVGLLISARSNEQSFNLASGLQVGNVFGAPVYKTKATFPANEGGTATADVIGYAGDFQGDAVYGTVEGVQVSISDQATLTDGAGAINLWQQNMFAVRAEIEVGFRVSDVDRFVKISDGDAA